MSGYFCGRLETVRRGCAVLAAGSASRTRKNQTCRNGLGETQKRFGKGSKMLRNGLRAARTRSETARKMSETVRERLQNAQKRSRRVPPFSNGLGLGELQSSQKRNAQKRFERGSRMLRNSAREAQKRSPELALDVQARRRHGGGSCPALPGLHDALCCARSSGSFGPRVAVVEPSAKTLGLGSLAGGVVGLQASEWFGRGLGRLESRA